MVAGSLLIAAFALALATNSARGDHLEEDVPSVDPSCRYVEEGAPGPAGNVLEVGLGNTTDVELERVDQRIRVNTMEGGFHREIRCEGGNATVTNIDSIALLHPPPGSGDDFDDYEDIFFFDDIELAIDLQDGLLAPGATPEADGSEIELASDGPGRPLLELNVILTPHEDQLRINTNSKRTLVNLNAGETTLDTDLTLPPAPYGNLYAGDGDDTIVNKLKIKRTRETRYLFFFGLGLGILGEGGDDRIKSQQVFGGDGDDRLTGGPRSELLIGGAGNDVLRGKNDSDFLMSAGGRDLLLAGGGTDGLISADGNGDKARCGDGRRDEAWVDRRDKRSGCERIRVFRGVFIDEDYLGYKSRLRTRSGKRIP